MSTVRLRRLQADFDKLADYLVRHPRLRLVEANGDPPEQYRIEYRIRSLRQAADDEIEPMTKHQVEISLPRNYPRTAPQCRMLTPVFHPNIAPHAICVGDHWSAGEPLWSIVARIGEMLAYQSYNVKSPLNGDAARWATEHADELPLDRVSLLLDEDDTPETPQVKATSRPASSQAVVSQTPPPAEADPILVICPKCKAKYRLPPKLAGKRARCKQCQGVIEIPG
ncbi:ubiquitin-conjugating enzyme E2 [Thalassoroseus pseudoceratinae]|uniref:ubiquitin-conjugating enzyme E2 n=1 Tax=Thalassoroseus pseudoceratinae TaxID=2713176 RepID=UPI0014210EEA|nr:ubiquitin-conjugating enzyme E2 [Thalassoroseus pseudoceratinae]